MSHKNFIYLAYLTLALGTNALHGASFTTIFKSHTDANLTAAQKSDLIRDKKTFYKASGALGLFGLSLTTAVKLYKKQPIAASIVSKAMLSTVFLASAGALWKNRALTAELETITIAEAKAKAEQDAIEEQKRLERYYMQAFRTVGIYTHADSQKAFTKESWDQEIKPILDAFPTMAKLNHTTALNNHKEAFLNTALPRLYAHLQKINYFTAHPQDQATLDAYNLAEKAQALLAKEKAIKEKFTKTGADLVAEFKNDQGSFAEKFAKLAGKTAATIGEAAQQEQIAQKLPQQAPAAAQGPKAPAAVPFFGAGTMALFALATKGATKLQEGRAAGVMPTFNIPGFGARGPDFAKATTGRQQPAARRAGAAGQIPRADEVLPAWGVERQDELAAAQQRAAALEAQEEADMAAAIAASTAEVEAPKVQTAQEREDAELKAAMAASLAPAPAPKVEHKRAAPKAAERKR